MSASNMDQLFSMSSEWLCCSTSEIHFWGDQYVHTRGVPELIDTTQANIRPPVDLESLSSTMTSFGSIPRYSDRSASSSLGRTSLGVSEIVKEADIAPVHPGSLSIDQSSGCSSISDSHIPMHECTSLSVPSYASTIVNSPKTFEPESLSPGDPYWEGVMWTNPPVYSPSTLSFREQPRREKFYPFTAPGTSGKKPRRAPGTPNTPTSRASTLENESPFVCLSCQCKFASKPSLHRHRKEVCDDEGEKRPFRCNQRLHYGCTQRFKRRCGLKDHYMKKLKLTEEQAVACIRDQYPKGMHRRRI